MDDVASGAVIGEYMWLAELILLIPFRAESILGNELTETSEFSSHVGNTTKIKQLSEEQLRKMVGIIHTVVNTLLFIIFCNISYRESLAFCLRKYVKWWTISTYI